MMQYGRIVPSNRKLAIAVFLVLFVMVISGGGPKAEEATTLPYQGLVRSYVLHLAPNQTEPRPLVMALHGLGESVEDLRGSWTFDIVEMSTDDDLAGTHMADPKLRQLYGDMVADASPSFYIESI